MYAVDKMVAIFGHPRHDQRPLIDTQVVCKRLSAVLAWCLIRQVCPAEVDAVEACAGGHGYGGLPPSVPSRCRRAAMELDFCLVAATGSTGLTASTGSSNHNKDHVSKGQG